MTREEFAQLVRDNADLIGELMKTHPLPEVPLLKMGPDDGKRKPLVLQGYLRPGGLWTMGHEHPESFVDIAGGLEFSFRNAGERYVFIQVHLLDYLKNPFDT